MYFFVVQRGLKETDWPKSYRPLNVDVGTLPLR